MQPVDGKYWTNVSSRHCPRQKSDQFVCAQWRNAPLSNRMTPRDSWIQHETDLSTIDADIESSNINLMAEINIVRDYLSKIFPSKKKISHVQKYSLSIIFLSESKIVSFEVLHFEWIIHFRWTSVAKKTGRLVKIKQKVMISRNLLRENPRRYVLIDQYRCN